MKMTERLLPVLGHQLAVLSANETHPGIPTVFLHGICGSIHFWQTLIPEEVRHTRPWYSISLPGHYPSVLPTDRRRRLKDGQFAELYDACLSKLVGDRPVAVVGWSTGGFAALNLAAHHPARVASACSIAGFARGKWRGLFGLLQKVTSSRKTRWLCRAVLQLLEKDEKLFRLAMAVAIKGSFSLPAVPIVDEVFSHCYKDFCRHDPAALTMLFQAISRFDISELLPRIQAPTLIVTGDRDSVIPRSEADTIAKKVPHARLVVLRGDDHLFFARHPGGAHRLLRSWLRSEATMKGCKSLVQMPHQCGTLKYG